MRRIMPCLILTLLLSGLLQAQQKYWIYPKVKMANKAALNSHASTLGITPVVISEWLQAYTAILTAEEVQQLKQCHGDLLTITPTTPLKILSAGNTIDLGKALQQMQADTIVHAGLSGKGVSIGIIDAGFLDADGQKFLQPIIADNRILGYRNFIETDINEPFEGSSKTNDHHGTMVFEFIAGKAQDNIQGLAYGASFYLARTDQADREYHGEEDYWIAALEWMHSQGVRLVNSSLGYSDGFDDRDTDYQHSDVDGTSTAITKAATIATRDKGMTIVISAGNDGNKAFEIISIPADAPGVISVGATGYRYWNKLGYSSIGPEHLKAVKPEVSCFAAGGTSFAAPVITGLVACMLEARPDISNNAIIEILQQSAHLYPFPNNYLGYGVPDARKVLKLLSQPDQDLSLHKKLQGTDSIRIDLPKSSNIMAFHKKTDYLVLEQEKLPWRDGSVLVMRKGGATHTTIADGYRVWEIEWID